ncbi:unnamed protein product [Chrysoparadoxa australica]
MSEFKAMRSHKPKLSAEQISQKRRDEMLSRQKKARRDLADHARRLAMEEQQVQDEVEGEESQAMEELDDEVGRTAERQQRRMRRRRRLQAKHWVGQFTTPEWMVTVPHDLNAGKGSKSGGGWLVMPRPEGKRVIIIASKGKTKARDMTGKVVKTFQSRLPGGSRHTACAQGDGWSILDGIFHELDQTFYATDVMAWKGYSLYDCTAEFRFYWLHSKLSEVNVSTKGDVPGENDFRIIPVPYTDCDAEGLMRVWESTAPFIKDGLLFMAKPGHYSLGVSPLALIWKDNHTTRYLTPSPGTKQGIVLVAGPESNNRVPLLTSCGTCLAKLESSTTELREGELGRFYIDGADEVVDHLTETLVPQVHNLVFDKASSLSRPAADSWSKILFQSRVRKGETLSIEALAAVAAEANVLADEARQGLAEQLVMSG